MSDVTCNRCGLPIDVTRGGYVFGCSRRAAFYRHIDCPAPSAANVTYSNKTRKSPDE